MGETVIKMPDIGEGITEAEVSEWQVAVGDRIAEDDVICVVMTEKAAVEIPSTVAGQVTWLGGAAGDVLAVGAPLVRVSDGAPEAAESAKAAPEPATREAADTEAAASGAEEPARETAPPAAARPAAEPPAAARPRAAAAVRQRARALGLDLAALAGTGPGGRITHADLDRVLSEGRGAPAPQDDTPEVTETRVIGLRRKIAERLTQAHAEIPQITIVEEIDVTELERLRAALLAERAEEGARLTLLPFLVLAIAAARHAAPQVNAHYDSAAGVLRQFAALHVGVATQTDKGLIVPVLRHTERLSIWEIAAAIADLAARGRAGRLPRELLAGSTITLTSLGPLGAVATTPLVNRPEVAIVGVNRRQIRPQWDGRAFVPREMMNVSASFDHRIVDGWDAAHFVARLKAVLETPALLFA